MNITDIDLNLLVFFDVLMRERNVSRAAEKLQISQPALSNALARLRKQLEDPLLIRTSRGMEPTEKALALHEPVQQAIRQLHDALIPSQPFDPGISHLHFTIACMDGVQYPLMARVVERLQKQAPKISLNLIPPGEHLAEQVERGGVDLAIDAFVEGLSDACHKRKLMTDGFSCVCRKDHPLFSRFGEFTMEAYLTYPHLRITRTGVGTGISETILQKMNTKRQVQVQIKQSALMPLYMVLESDLIATVPHWTAQHLATHLPIALLPPPIELPEFTLEMGWGPVMHHHRGHRWLRDLILECAIELYDSDAG